MTSRVIAALVASIVGAALPASLDAQEVVGHATERSAENAVVTFQLADGGQLVIEIRDGRVSLNGTPVGSTSTDTGQLSALDVLLDSAEMLSTSELLGAIRRIEAEQFEIAAVEEALEALAAAEVEIVLPEIADAPAPRAERAATGVARVRPARPAPPAVSRIVIGEEMSATFAGGLAIAAANLFAVFIALGFMGLGFLFFVPKQLETVADTVWHSFWRSFLAGLFAQPLILPVFGAMIVGLALTVVGILVVPFAIVGFLMAVFLAAVGGFIAVARTVGEIYLRRKMARGEPVDTWGSYRYIVYGLTGLLAIWLPVVALGWIPVAGTLLTVSAGLITWILATAGFGAAIISRAGLRGTFVRQLDLALTDEQYWTEDAMPTQPRHGSVERYR
jgi:hypothetical protein